MKAITLMALALLAGPAYGQNFPKTDGQFGHVYWMHTVSDGEALAHALEAVIKTYLPGAREDDK